MLRTLLAFSSLTFTLTCAQADDAAGVEAFEKTIRPLFVEHCGECHGAKKQQAGLRLDTVAGIRKGASDGAVIVVGKPKESRLIQAVRRGGDIKMPPEKELPDAAVKALTAWIESGAPMPKDAAVASIDAKKHWAFQPVKAVTVPNVAVKGRTVTDLDRFLAVKISEKGLGLSPPADPRTRLRRVYYDLIGLPPSEEEVDAFAKDPSQEAYSQVVDKLLASPQYGERWARHWLDVARYSDTKGYVFTEDRSFPFSYTYRDYVIRSFNDDKPYDQFVKEQIAADKLDLGSDNRALAALGFLTLGRRFNNNPHDIIDDRIEVVTRGFLGLSVGCARCHDHKFDPIPTRDYYSLYGVFASSREPGELPLLTGMPRTKESDEFDAELAKLEAAAEAFHAKMTNEALAQFRTAGSIAAYLLAVRDVRGLPQNKAAQIIVERKLHTTMVERWKKLIEAPGAKDDAVFRGWRAFADSTDDKGFIEARRRVRADEKLNPLLRDALAEAETSTIEDVAAIFGEIIANAGRGKSLGEDEKPLRAVLQATTHYEELEDGDEQFVTIAVKNEYRKLRNAAQSFQATSPKAPPRAMVLQDAPQPMEPVVFIRGNPGNRGSHVPRQFLEVIAGSNRKPFSHGSGRLDLANAIAAAENPLTARVIVNRVWAWHFGQGLVRTPSDFGVRSDPASHPELLDWLAGQLVVDGWSLKKLHRRIVLSATYQQSSAITDQALAADPENLLLTRSPRQRLDFEQLRDALLAAGGTLDLAKIGGRSEDIFKTPFGTRRSVYAYIERQNLPGTFRNFDFASPDSHAPQRFRTTVPQQALFLMNSPFVAEMAKKAAARAEAKDDVARIESLYRLILSRNPSEAERDLAVDYLENAPVAGKDRLGPWEQLAQTLLMSNEFAFVD